MITLSGKSVFGGVAIGKIAFYKKTGKAGKTVSCRGYRSRGGTF